ncbi:MAG: T9SS type A sorting domain-containing protein [Bacteroidetes bacterium]|nr:T9SS type A sorting domain-containing protein [Bacteroidota bacterium]
MKKTTTLLFAGIITIGAMSFDIYNEDGTKTNRTGGHGESGCTCHSATTSAISITSTPDLSAGYMQDSTYTLHLTVTETGKTVFGIDLQALSTATVNIGTLTAGTGTQKITATNGLDNITHVLDGGLTNDAHTFDFTWKAPATSAGTVTFWYSGVAGNSNQATSGDSNCKGSWVINNVTAIAENAISNILVSVFPNPSSESMNVKFSLKETSSVVVDLMDINGNKVSNLISESGMKGDINRTFDVSSYSKGVYFLQIRDEKSSSLKKIVIE